MSNSKPSLVAPLTGVVMGVGVFLGVNIVSGRAVIPTAESVTTLSHGLSQPKYPVAAAATAGGPTGGAYQTICQACHQADGNGLPGAFPPLAGSEWMTADPETPIRIVLLGLTGAIEVKGQKFNAIMPPPVGITDEQVAEAVTYARTNFGNTAGAVDVELVKQVRASLAGRTQSWTAAELLSLRAAAPDPSPAPTEPGAPAAPATGAAGAPAQPAPAAAPTAAAPTEAAAPVAPAPPAAPTTAPSPAKAP
jgi:mono/diheme cytochrome c family protein